MTQQPERRIIAETGNGSVIGDFLIHVHDGWGQGGTDPALVAHQEAEIGWTVDPAYAGRGYASEVAQALVDLAFTRLAVRRVIANAFADNAPSIRIMEKIGMRRESFSLKDSLHKTRGWIDGVRYALLAEEYRGSDA